MGIAPKYDENGMVHFEEDAGPLIVGTGAIIIMVMVFVWIWAVW